MSKQLTIDLSPFGATFTVLTNSMVGRSASTSFDNSEETHHKERLEKLLVENPWLREEYDDVTLGWAGQKSSLVPNNVFADSDAEKIFQLCFGGETPSDEIDYNRISELGIVNVYQIPVWIKSFFVIRYPRIVMQHGTSHFLRKSLESNAFRAKVTAVVYRDYFFLNVVKHNELQFFSSFEASTNEDLLYHLVFVLQQKELTNEEGNIELVSASQNQLKLDDAVEMLQKIKELSKYRASLNESFVSSSQALCV